MDEDSVVMIVIDEISTCTPSYIRTVDLSLREFTGKDLPFGGFAVFFTGDYMQIKPVQGVSTPKAMMAMATTNANSDSALLETYGVGSRNRAGCALLADFCCHKFETQQRAKNDAVHTAFINRMHSGESITMEDLQMYQLLSAKDMVSDDWRFAPIIVATNRERIDIITQQAPAFAKSQGIPVVRWPLAIKQWVNRPSTPSMRATFNASRGFEGSLFLPILRVSCRRFCDI
jgi:hypothetical protein